MLFMLNKFIRWIDQNNEKELTFLKLPLLAVILLQRGHSILMNFCGKF